MFVMAGGGSEEAKYWERGEYEPQGGMAKDLYTSAVLFAFWGAPRK